MFGTQQLTDRGGSGTKHEMIAVTEDSLDTERREIGGVEGLDRRLRSDRKERGRLHGTVGCREPSPARTAARIRRRYLERHHGWLAKQRMKAQTINIASP